MKIRERIGFIGAGKMAGAFIEGILNSKIIEKTNLGVSDISEERINFFKSLGIKTFTDNRQLYNESDIIFFAVKPDIIKEISKELKPVIKKDKLIVSIAAGIETRFIEKILGKDIPIIRVMPNTPALVGAGMSVYTINNKVTDRFKIVIETILRSIGEVIFMEEKYLDAVTGLSGSGPAFVFMVINSLAAGGVKAGLPKSVALRLAAQTVFGAAKMVIETKKHPEELLDMVTSPGGTTIAGIHSLEENKIRAAFIEAVEKATLRAKELK